MCASKDVEELCCNAQCNHPNALVMSQRPKQEAQLPQHECNAPGKYTTPNVVVPPQTDELCLQICVVRW